MITLLAGICQVLAWHFPGELLGGLFGLVSILFLVLNIIRGTYLSNYLFTLICYSGGFYWLISTFQDFGGLNLIASSFVFFCFCTLSSLSGLLVKYFYNKTKNLSLSTSGFIFIAIQSLPFIIFPWSPIHPLLPFYHFTSIASIGGVGLLTILAFNLPEAIYRKKFIEAAVYAVSICGLSLISQNQKFTELNHLDISVVQANISTEKKNNLKYFNDNLREYVGLSESIKDTDLIIWAESSFNRPVDLAQPKLYIKDFGELKFEHPLLTGFLSYDATTDKYYNSVSLFDGTSQSIYHKRILMPFGEFTPFAKTFPFLAQLNPTAAQFEAGTTSESFKYQGLNISPLICYEDLIPELSAESIYKSNANILVSFSNDAWFGDTVANKQHNLIASFRSIETQRFLVRATNSGLTAVINTKGQTISKVPVFSSQILNSQIIGYSDSSFYTKLLSIINLNYLALGFLVLVYILRYRS